MAGVNWNPQQLKTIAFNPNQGLQLAQNAAKNITDTFADKRKEESLAQYRQHAMQMDERKQNYTEGADDRALAEAQRKEKEAAEKARYINSLASGFAMQGSERFGSEEFNALLSQNENWANASPEERQKMQTEYLMNNRGMSVGADPKIFQQRFREALHESDKNLSNEQVNAAVQEQTQRLFPTMDWEQQSKLLDVNSRLGKNSYVDENGNVVYGGSSSGSPKFLTPQTSAAGIRDVAANVTETFGLDKSPDMVLWSDKRYDIGDINPTQADMAKLSGDLLSLGITSPAAIEAAIHSSFNTDGKTLKYDPRYKEGINEIYKIAKLNQDAIQQQQTKDGKLLGAESQSSVTNRAFDNIDKIMSRGTARKLSDEELAQKFLTDTFGSEGGIMKPPKQKAAVVENKDTPPPVAETENTETVQPQPQPQAETGRILSPAGPDYVQRNDDPLLDGMLPQMKGGYGRYSGEETKELNDSLKKVRLFSAAPDKNKQPTIKELKLALEHPGTDDQEQDIIQKLLSEQSVERRSSRQRGPRNQ